MRTKAGYGSIWNWGYWELFGLVVVIVVVVAAAAAAAAGSIWRDEFDSSFQSSPALS